MNEPVRIRKLPMGIPGLDAVLGGGLPEFSFNLVAGAPGCGKTTLVHQFAFENATEAEPAIYFTVVGEPPIKMLRYQQQFSFFDPAKVGTSIRFVHLGKEMLEGGLPLVLRRIEDELEASSPRIVIVDSFRSLAGPPRGDSSVPPPEGGLDLERFVQLLALALTSYQATTFLVGEYAEYETNRNPVFTVADGILWLHQTTVRNSVVRRLQVIKMRGQEQVPGLHTVKLTAQGMRVFPRIGKPLEGFATPTTTASTRRTGIAGLDEMLGGGIPSGFTVLVGGPSGSGKSTLATQFLLEGAKDNERGVIALFEKRPEEYLRGNSRREELDRLIDASKVELVYVRPLDLSVDEALEELRSAVARSGASRVVIDSVSGLELALAPSFQDDFRESLYRMVGALTSMGVTVMMTVELTDSFTELRLGPPGFAFLADGIILQRYVELEGCLRKVMSVVKLRAADHSKELRTYEIGADGIVVGPVLSGYRGILNGSPIAVGEPTLP